MKNAKKALSLFLSLLMIFTACSVGFNGAFIASAAATADEVKTLVDKAVAAADISGATGDSWSFTVTSKETYVVLEAAQAVYDYAVSVLGARSINTDDLAAEVSANLGYATGSEAAQLVKNIISPSGTAVYNASNTTKTATGTTTQAKQYAAGQAIDAGQYTVPTGLNAVTKTATVKVNERDFLLSYDSIEAFPENIVSEVSFSFTNTTTHSASATAATDYTAASGSGSNAKPASYKTNYKAVLYHVISAKSTTPSTLGVKARFADFVAAFTEDILAQTRMTLLAKSEAQLKSEYNTAYAAFNPVYNNYGKDFIDHFYGVGTTDKITAYLADLTFAERVVAAIPSVVALYEAITADYNEKNYDEMYARLASVNALEPVSTGLTEEEFSYIVDFKNLTGFSLAAVNAFKAAIYLDMETVKVEEIKAAVDADIATYLPLVQDKYNEADIEDAVLQSLPGKFTSYGNAINAYSTAAIARVFPEGYATYIAEISTLIAAKLEARGIQAVYHPFYDHFAMIFTDFASWKNADFAWEADDGTGNMYLTGKYEADTAKLAELKTSYNELIASYDAATVEKIFTVNYQGEDMNLITAVEKYLAVILDFAQIRVEETLTAIGKYGDADSTTTAIEVNFSNVVQVGTALVNYSDILYRYMDAKGRIGADYNAIAAKITAINDAYTAFIASGGLGDFAQVHFDDNGIYTIRYAGAQYDEDGNLIGYENDLARDGADDNYEVTVEKIEALIDKLDGFISSEEFCSLLNLADAEGNPYTSIDEAVNGMLGGLFTDATVNMLVGMLFPMVANLLETELATMLADLAGGGTEPPEGVSAQLPLGDLITDYSVDGLLDVYLNYDEYNGQVRQKSYAQVFSEIDVNLYPEVLAKQMVEEGILSADSDFYKMLVAAKENWAAVAVDPSAEALSFAFEHEWGVTDYESFVKVVGGILDCLGPIGPCLISNYTIQTPTVTQVGYAATHGKVKISGLPLVGSISGTIESDAGLALGIQPVNIYDKIWIPLLEALGHTDRGHEIAAIPADADGETLLKCLLDPLFVLLDDILDAPVNSVLEILPALSYILSIDKITTILNTIEIQLSVELKLGDSPTVKLDGLASLVQGIVEGLIKGLALPFDVDPINLGAELNLIDLIGTDFRNMNELIGMIAPDMNLPPIQQTDLIYLAELDKNASSYRSSGKRLKFTADKADLLYYLLQYATGMLNADMLGSLLGEGTELPAFVNDLLADLGNDPIALFTVLSEIMVPQTYSMTDVDWYVSEFKNGDINATVSPYNTVYLKYGTDWQREDAVALVANLDELLKTVLQLAGSDIDINTYLPEMVYGALEGAFTNETLTSVISGIASLGKTEMDPMIGDILAEVLEADLYELYNVFGYLFVTEEEMAAEGFVAPLAPGAEGYVNNTGLEASVDENGVITWTLDGTAMEDGNRDMFFSILFKALAPFMPTLEKLLTGGKLQALGLLEIPCYDGYAYTLAQLLEVLGAKDILSQAEFEALAASDGIEAALMSVIDAVFARLDEILSGSVVLNLAEVLPNLLYYIESNGLSAFIRNLLKPVLVLVDSIRPLVDVDLNAILTYFVSELVNGKELALDADVIINMIFSGEIPVPEDPENYTTVAIDVTDLRLSTILRIADAVIGTDLYNSTLVNPGLDAMFAFTESYTSASGETAYRTTIETPDALTVLISAALEALMTGAGEGKTNADVIFALIGDENITEIITAVLSLIDGKDIGEYLTPDWAYMYEDTDDSTALDKLIAADGYLPMRTGNAFDIYTQYQNNWSEETAEYINGVLDMFVKNIVDLARNDGSTLGTLLDNAIVNGIYSDSLLNSLIEAVVGLIVDYESIVAAAGGLLDAEGLLQWVEWCEITENADGTRTVTCVKDWGIDSAATNEAKKTAFVEGFVETLRPAYRLLAWLLFGEDITFFDGATKEALITVTGGEGYKYGFIPLLEALGGTMNYEGTDTGIKPADAYYVSGKLDMEAAVRDIFTCVTGILTAICGDLQNVTEGRGTLSAMLNLLPTVFYFINADGVKSVVNNLLKPVVAVTNELGAFGLELDFATLIPTVDITNLDFSEVFSILENLLSLYFPDYTQEFIKSFYIGKAEMYTSANGEQAFRLVFTEEETRADLITVIISFIADAFTDPRNEARLKGWFGDNGIYEVIMAYLEGKAVQIPVAPIEWQLTEHADTGKVFSPVVMDSIYSNVYGELYTREMGEYIEKWFPEFIDTMIVLLGVQKEDGKNYKGLEDVLDTLVGSTVYKSENITAIQEAVLGLISDLKTSVGEEFFTQISNILNTALGVDISLIESFTVEEFEEGDRDAFVGELLRFLTPVYPVLSWLLADESISFFHTADGTGRDRVVLPGAEGYKYGIIPILEALGCEGILTYDEYKAASDDPEMLLRAVVDPILDKVEILLADPVNEIVELLPGVIYFINSNGLDAAVRNVLNAVFSLIETIEPITGEMDLFEAIGFDFRLNFEDVIRELLKGIEEDTGFRLQDLAIDALNELTVGEVVSFTSKNGLQAYTMKYATGADRADMISIVLRLVLSFVSIEDNVIALESLLAGTLNEEGYMFLCSLLENFSQMAASDGGIDEIMYTVYQIFYAANVAAHKTENWLADFNGDFTFLKQLFATSDLPFLQDIGKSLSELLDNAGEGIFDSNGLASLGLIEFFKRILEFFKKVLDIFKPLLGEFAL